MPLCLNKMLIQKDIYLLLVDNSLEHFQNFSACKICFLLPLRLQLLSVIAFSISPLRVKNFLLPLFSFFHPLLTSFFVPPSFFSLNLRIHLFF